MMNSSVITPPAETKQRFNPSIETIITVAANKPKVVGSLQSLPVVFPSPSLMHDSFIQLFWRIASTTSQSLSHKIKSLLEQGASLWIEAFSAVASIQELETTTTNPTNNPTQLSPAFRLNNEDTEASLVSSFISEQRFNTVVNPRPLADQEAWLPPNQWSELDDLFPVAPEPTIDRESLKPTVVEEHATVVSPETVSEAIMVTEALPSPTVTSNTILNALHEAYPITTPEEEACLKHPLIQRGREVKSSINELVDAYFADDTVED
jgi:hypothetical protein